MYDQRDLESDFSDLQTVGERPREHGRRALLYCAYTAQLQ